MFEARDVDLSSKNVSKGSSHRELIDMGFDRMKHAQVDRNEHVRQ